MTKLYLITGFLGAGKTTFLKEFAKLFAGQRLSILVNEFGKEDVDSTLLKELQASLEAIHNGSIFCACRLEQFEQALAAMAAKNPDVILIETSGLSDPTSIRRILSDEEKFGNIIYMGCICLADAVNFEKVFSTAMACRKQLEISNIVVLNKADLAQGTQGIRQLIEQHHPNAIVMETNYGKIPSSWAEIILQPPGIFEAGTIQTKDLSIQSYLITIRETFPPDRLAEFLTMFAANTYRIKGFAHLSGNWYFADCVGSCVKVTACEPGSSPNRLVVLAGQGMPAAAAIKQAAERWTEYIICVD
jgi:G3E family GTPase